MKKKVLVLGLGLSGLAAAEQLLKEGTPVLAVDQREETLRQDPAILPLLEQGLTLLSEEEPLSFASISWVLLSPGIPPTHPLVQQAHSHNLEIIGEIEFALQRLPNLCLGVTGSNGKTTTTLLTEHILQFHGIPARALGNVGRPLSSYISSINPEEILILELSSFQLETLFSRRLRAAVILNIMPNHLDRYPSMREYAAAKLRIASCLIDKGELFISSSVLPYTSLGTLFDTSPSLSQNEQAAFRLCELFHLSLSDCRQAARSFQRPAHRLEWVAEKNNITYYNDSKATSVDAVLFAVNSLPSPIILLAGGQDKGAPYTPWISSFAQKVKMLIAFGAAASKMELELAAFLPFRRVATLDEAVLLASQLAEKGTTILLSPGCSSYDQYRNFEERGEAFKCLVKGIL